jgi:hypothetical protein
MSRRIRHLTLRGELTITYRTEYLALLASLVLVLLETIIHLITFCLREWTALQYLDEGNH